jgi:rRNA maturation endonuclease Nob1
MISTVLVNMARVPASLKTVLVCPACDACFEIGAEVCPGCGNEDFLPLSELLEWRMLNITGLN